jgi:MarR family transcriptional regulator, negative regulator of the multidrug operon emrRAB
MKNTAHIWLERLSSLRLSLLRQAATKVGLQAIHVEILEYLGKSNKYSNTGLALSEFLGVTKGSVSQSLKLLEEKGLVDRVPCPTDKRYSRLSLSKKGADALTKAQKEIPDLPNMGDKVEQSFRAILLSWQTQNKLKTFGLCITCKYNEQLDNGKYLCGLTQEALTRPDTQKICREHEFETTRPDKLKSLLR